jgi:uncharacterized membrane protein YbhN (UPF0104 family)
VLTSVKIGAIGVAYWALFLALGFSEDLFVIIPLVAASSIVAYAPVSVNGIGTVEAVGILLFSSVGIPETAVLSAYVTLRFLVLILAWGPAGLWLLIKWRGSFVRKCQRDGPSNHTSG